MRQRSGTEFKRKVWSKRWSPRARAGTALEAVPAIFLQDGTDFQEKIRLEEGFVRAVVGPGAEEASVITVAEPVGYLFDGGLSQVVGESGLAGGGSVAGEDVAAGVGDAAS